MTKANTIQLEHLIHADWSIEPRKRWLASAVRDHGCWCASAPRPVGSMPNFLQGLLSQAESQRVLAGFDFPIGVPRLYGERTGLTNFRHALTVFGSGEWANFYHVADSPAEVAITRPFYPRGCRKGVTRSTLVTSLGVSCFADLLRICERRTPDRQAACALFWTLGGNQVGRAALSGWSEVIRPALASGARLWPFDGALADLGKATGLVMAETYPAEAYSMFGARFLRSESKRRQADRQKKAPAILSWALAHSVHLTSDAEAAVRDGFGGASSGEDAFDAFAGLIKMIEVAEGRRPEASEQPPASLNWEGWILGR